MTCYCAMSYRPETFFFFFALKLFDLNSFEEPIYFIISNKRIDYDLKSKNIWNNQNSASYQNS